MNQHDFENRILQLWMTTRVPLTRANLLFFTRAPRKKIEAWLDTLVADGVLDIDSDAQGEMLWLVRGAERPASGPERVQDVVKLDQLSKQVGLMPRRRGALDPSLPALGQAGFVRQALARQGGKKNVLVSGALSAFGPIGWVYAGPLREVIPAAVLYYVVLPWIIHALPFVGWPLSPLLGVLSVVVGVLYALQYNQAGRATPLLTGGDDEPPRLTGRR